MHNGCHADPGMLIRGAEVWGHGLADVLLEDGRIAAIGQLFSDGNTEVIDGSGGLLIPGLHDHHIHLAALAVRQNSLWCGPPHVKTAQELAERLQQPGEGWIRAIGYHESVMGLPGAAELDRLMPTRPLRIQHRGGRMWLLNSLALAELLKRAEPPPGLERNGSQFTGRLFDEDQWLRFALGGTPPSFTSISATLASYGVTGITDMSPSNDAVMAAHFAAEMTSGSLLQRCVLAGKLSLADAKTGPWQLGPAKLHLHETALPAFDDVVAFITQAHHQNRAVAVHCTTEVELVFTLAALAQAGVMKGDRIEHGSVASDGLVDEIARLGLAVCVQPHFITERGEQYLSDVEPRDLPGLYRIQSFAYAGIILAGGSDAPFASADPWAAMAAAVSRSTREGTIIGAVEALTPEAALALYLADPHDLNRMRSVSVGAPGDLCLLDRPWSEVRGNLSANHIRATFVGGNCIYQAPMKRLPR
jgi:predicted amidohydrolase YtcJ